MMYFRLNGNIDNGTVVEVAYGKFPGNNPCALWIGRHEIKDFNHAERLAKEATGLTKKLHVAIDNGDNVWPRFDVAPAPEVGADVSYAFNGDSYPDGQIISVSNGPRMVVKTSNGNVYYRRRQTGSWIMQGGTWSLINGHHREWNPEF